MIDFFKTFFASSFNVGFEINPIRWRLVARCPSFDRHDIDAYIVIGPLSLHINAFPAI